MPSRRVKTTFCRPAQRPHKLVVGVGETVPEGSTQLRDRQAACGHRSRNGNRNGNRDRNSNRNANREPTTEVRQSQPAAALGWTGLLFEREDDHRASIVGCKRPQSVRFVADDEMPRTATGEVLHCALRNRPAAGQRCVLHGTVLHRSGWGE